MKSLHLGDKRPKHTSAGRDTRDNRVEVAPWQAVALLALCALSALGACRRNPAPAADARAGDGATASDGSVAMSVRELDAFKQKYGPDHFSEREEEWLIRDYFQDRRGGLFVDVGANHYKIASKTFYLESRLGWSGIAIEPQREFGEEYAKYRPRTRFLPFFVSDASNQTAKLYLRRRKDQVASSNEAFVRTFGTPAEVRDVPTMTLDDILESEGVGHIDLLSIDIELHEPEALRGFTIERFKPSLVCIEGLLPVRQQILDYFAAHGYVVIGKYMWVDLENLYFEPLSGQRTAAPTSR
jgi:FkbM family methyltransferase